MGKGNIDILLNLNSDEAEKRLKRLQAAADALKNKFGHLQKDGENFSQFTKRMKADASAVNSWDKIGKSINGATNQLDRYASKQQSVFAGMKKLWLINKAFNFGSAIISSGFSLTKNFITDAYDEYTHYRMEKSGLQAKLVSNKEADKIVTSIDKLAETMTNFGFKYSETMEIAKQMASVFPKANAAFMENIVNTTELISKATGRNYEEISSAIRLVLLEHTNDRHPFRTLKNLGMTDEQIISMEAEAKRIKKGLQARGDKDASINSLLETLYNNQAKVAEAMANQDPFAAIKGKLMTGSLELGRTIYKALSDPGIQNLLTQMTNRMIDFIKSLDAAKVAGIIEKIVNFGDLLITGVQNFLHYLDENLPRSKWAKQKDTEKLDNIISQGKVNYVTKQPNNIFGYTPYPAQSKINNNSNTSSAYTLKNPDDDLEALLQQSYKKSTDLYKKNRIGFAKPQTFEEYKEDVTQRLNQLKNMTDKELSDPKIQKELDENNKMMRRLLDKWKFSAYNPSLNQNIQAVSYNKNGAAAGIPSNRELNIENDVSRVKGEKPQIININIEKQIGEVKVTEVDLSRPGNNKLYQNILATLEEALMTAETIFEKDAK